MQPTEIVFSKLLFLLSKIVSFFFVAVGWLVWSFSLLVSLRKTDKKDFYKLLKHWIDYQNKEFYQQNNPIAILLNFLSIETATFKVLHFSIPKTHTTQAGKIWISYSDSLLFHLSKQKVFNRKMLPGYTLPCWDWINFKTSRQIRQVNQVHYMSLKNCDFRT